MSKKNAVLEKTFLELLLVFSMTVLAFSALLFVYDYNQYTQRETTIDSINRNINNTLNSEIAANLTQLDKLQYHDNILMKLIDWGGQGTISWGVTFLAAISVFFMVLLELHPKENNRLEAVHFRKSDIALSVLAFVFLLVSLLSILEIVYYYRYVAGLQNDLATVSVPQGIAYSIIVNFGYIEVVFTVATVVAVICLGWAYKKEK